MPNFEVFQLVCLTHSILLKSKAGGCKISETQRAEIFSIGWKESSISCFSSDAVDFLLRKYNDKKKIINY